VWATLRLAPSDLTRPRVSAKVSTSCCHMSRLSWSGNHPIHITYPLPKLGPKIAATGLENRDVSFAVTAYRGATLLQAQVMSLEAFQLGAGLPICKSFLNNHYVWKLSRRSRESMWILWRKLLSTVEISYRSIPLNPINFWDLILIPLMPRNSVYLKGHLRTKSGVSDLSSKIAAESAQVMKPQTS